MFGWKQIKETTWLKIDIFIDTQSSSTSVQKIIDSEEKIEEMNAQINKKNRQKYSHDTKSRHPNPRAQKSDCRELGGLLI